MIARHNDHAKKPRNAVTWMASSLRVHRSKWVKESRSPRMSTMRMPYRFLTKSPPVGTYRLTSSTPSRSYSAVLSKCFGANQISSMQSDSVCALIMPLFLTSRSSPSIRATIAHFPQPISDTRDHCGRYTQRAVNLGEVVREVRTFYRTQDHEHRWSVWTRLTAGQIKMKVRAVGAFRSPSNQAAQASYRRQLRSGAKYHQQRRAMSTMIVGRFVVRLWTTNGFSAWRNAEGITINSPAWRAPPGNREISVVRVCAESRAESCQCGQYPEGTSPRRLLDSLEDRVSILDWPTPHE
jgi:hypothetical protein